MERGHPDPPHARRLVRDAVQTVLDAEAVVDARSGDLRAALNAQLPEIRTDVGNNNEGKGS